MVSRLFAVAAVVLGFASVPVQAQEPSASHVAVARELVVLTGVASGADEIIPALVDDVKRQMLTQPDLQKDVDLVLKMLAPELELQRQQAATIVARVYAKWMSEPELKEVIAFYKTPVGAKFSKLQSDITEDAIKDMTAWSTQVAEYVMTRTRVEMTKRGHKMP